MDLDVLHHQNSPAVFGGAFALAFAFGVIAFPSYINWLKSRNIEQFLREEGPESHKHKAKTPTMGGLCLIGVSLIAFAILSLVFQQDVSPLSAMTFTVALLCGYVGLADDLAKVHNRANQGLSASKRLMTEAILGMAFGLMAFAALRRISPTMPAVLLPQAIALHVPAFNVIHIFQGLHKIGPIMPASVYVPLSLFLVAATTNAVNLHDGMDGLAGGTSLLVLLTMAAMLWLSGQYPLALLATVVAGAVAGFLVFNRNPARVFMGDTGSLFLGGIMAGLTVAGGLVFWFVPLSLVYILETISVIVQVSYYKLTKPYTPPAPTTRSKIIWTKLTNKLPGEGKRIFRMAPLHHHFEAVFAERGVREWQVVAAFWAVQALLCGITLAAFCLF